MPQGQATTSGRRGRPRVPREKAKRYAVGIRTTKELKDLLQRAADSSGRSVAQEIELRLVRSTDEDQALGGARAAALFRALAAVAQDAEGAGEDWLDDYASFQMVRQAWDELLDRRAPPRPAEIDSIIKGAREIAEVITRKPDDFPPSLNRGQLTAILLALTLRLPKPDRDEFIAAAAVADAIEQPPGVASERAGFSAMGWIPGHGR